MQHLPHDIYSISESVAMFGVFSSPYDRPIMMPNENKYQVASFGKQTVLMEFTCRLLNRMLASLIRDQHKNTERKVKCRFYTFYSLFTSHTVTIFLCDNFFSALTRKQKNNGSYSVTADGFLLENPSSCVRRVFLTIFLISETATSIISFTSTASQNKVLLFYKIIFVFSHSS